jgi:O-antigen/teichoic acid export membrane protein
MSTHFNEVEVVLPSKITDRLWRGLASTALSQVLSAANAILLVPLFLHAWGANGYGQWLSLTAFVSYLSLLDLGGQNFIGNLLAQEYVCGNVEMFRKHLSEGVSLFTLIALVVFAMLGIALSLPGLSLPGQNVPIGLDERLILLLMGASFLLSIPSGVYVTAYRATGLFARGTMVGNILRAVSLPCYVAILIVGLPPTIYAVGYLATGIIGTLVIIWDIQRQISVCRHIKLKLASIQTGRVYLGGSLYFWLLALANALNQQGVILILAASRSPTLVAIYATHRTISGIIGYVANLFQAPLWPELTFVHAQQNNEKLMRMSLLVVKMVVFLSGTVALGLWMFLPVIYPIWTGKNIQFHPILMAVLLIQAVLAAGWTTSGWALLASNQHRSLAYWTLANAGVTLAFAIILASKFGCLGVAFATLLGDVICGITAYPMKASQVLGIPVRKIYQAIFSPVAALAIPGLLLFLANSFMHGWPLSVVGVLIIIISIYLTRYLVFTKYELNWLVSRVQVLGKCMI